MMNYNIIVVGGDHVGKTAMIVRYIRGEFPDADYMPEDIDYKKEIMMYKPTQHCSFYVIDVGTPESTDDPDLRQKTLTYGDGFVLVYSITDRSTFKELQDLREEILVLKAMDDVPIVLVGNKSDLQEERAVSKADGINLARSFNNCTFIETSAKENVYVNEVFQALAEKVYRKFPPPKIKTMKKRGVICAVL